MTLDRSVKSYVSTFSIIEIFVVSNKHLFKANTVKKFIVGSLMSNHQHQLHLKSEKNKTFDYESMFNYLHHSRGK